MITHQRRNAGILALALVPACLGTCRAQTKAPSPSAHAVVPDNGVLTFTDYGLRDWGPEVVHYRLDTKKFKPKKLELLDAAGKAIPFQIGESQAGTDELSFVAAVAKGQSVSYTLRNSARDRSGENSALAVKKNKDGMEVGNSFYTLSLPLSAAKKFERSVDAGSVPPPLLRWKQNGFGWMGGSHFITSRRIAEYSFEIAEQGPATILYRARYRFAPGGEYVLQARVSSGVPVALITEEFDFGRMTDDRDFLMLDAGSGWKPAQISFLASAEHQTEVKYEPVAPLLERKAKEWQKARAEVTVTTPPLPTPPADNLVSLGDIGAAWGARNGLSLRGDAPTTEGSTPAAPSVSISPYNFGSWRRAMPLPMWNDPARGIEVALPLGVHPLRWYRDHADDMSPFSSHEDDNSLPDTYGRRVWALGFGLQDALKTRMDLGYIGLDRYKDWIIDWPENAKAVFPRAYTTPELVARLRRGLEKNPEKELLQKLYLFDGKPETAIANARTVIERLKSPYTQDWTVIGLSAYIQAYQYTFTVYAEDALSCPQLPADLRRDLRRWLALYANLASEPDYNPRGSGLHLGNNNMPIGRTLMLMEFAPLLPDHPRYSQWMNALKEYTTWKMAVMAEPGGAWLEPPTYQMYGPARSLSVAQTIVRNSGWGDISKLGYQSRVLEYDANLTMPDARFKGFRILPGMGNSGDTLEGIFGIAAGALTISDPDEAGFLKFMHHLTSGNDRLSLGKDPDYSLQYPPADVPPQPRPLTTTFIPGYGVAFRAHFGSPDETAMLFRCGFSKGHWDMDDLNVILYGQGAPLSPGTGYQYYSGPALENNAIVHNRVKVGKVDAPQLFGRAENNIQDYGFGPSVDYAVGRIYYPPEMFEDKREMEWRRHIVFVKSERPQGANYFVMRDTFPGGENRPTWWHWLNLDGPEMITQNNHDIEMKTKYGASTHFWFAGDKPLPGKVVRTFDYNFAPNYHHRAFGKSLGVPDQDDKETKTIYQLAGAPGADYFYVVYPRRDNEPLPAFSQPAPGCIKVVTRESTDYVFESDTPLNFDADGVLFTGKAGAVRVFPDRVVLAMNSGSGRIGYKGAVVEGDGPFERTIPLANLQAGTTKLSDGYEKKIISQNIGGGIIVSGEAPFDAKLVGQEIRIRTSGRKRVIEITRPAFISYPQLILDGQEWRIGWTDYPSSGWGTYKNTALMAATTLDGEHNLVIRQRTIPDVWPKQFTPLVGAQAQNFEAKVR